MKAAAALLVAMLAGCGSTGARKDERVAIALRNAGFEAPARPGARCPEGWACTMHADPDSFRFFLDRASAAEGRQSACVERVMAEPWAVISQSLPAASLRGLTLTYSVALTVASSRGGMGGGGGPWVLVHGPSGVTLHEEKLAASIPSWERHAITFTVPADAQSFQVGATLVGGGRLCLDDARLDHRKQ